MIYCWNIKFNMILVNYYINLLFVQETIYLFYLHLYVLIFLIPLFYSPYLHHEQYQQHLFLKYYMPFRPLSHLPLSYNISCFLNHLLTLPILFSFTLVFASALLLAHTSIIVYRGNNGASCDTLAKLRVRVRSHVIHSQRK